jgi:hypothetical protein
VWTENTPVQVSGENARSPVFDLFWAWYFGLCAPSQFQLRQGEPNMADIIYQLTNQAPNLTLNSLPFSPNRLLLTATGIVVQAAVLLLTGVFTFYLKYLKATRPFSPIVGYVMFVLGMEGSLKRALMIKKSSLCFSAGTFFINAGLIICCQSKP